MVGVETTVIVVLGVAAGSFESTGVVYEPVTPTP